MRTLNLGLAAFSVCLVASCGCSRQPSLVGTWAAVGPLKERVTLTLRTDGTYASKTCCTAKSGRALACMRSGSYVLDGDRLLETQTTSVSMSGHEASEVVDLPAATVRWLSPDRFEASDASGRVVYRRESLAR